MREFGAWFRFTNWVENLFGVLATIGVAFVTERTVTGQEVDFGDAGTAAMRRSKDLVEDRWWPLFGRSLGLVLIVVPAIVVVALPTFLAYELLQIESVALEVLSSVLTDLVLAFVTIAFTLMFLNLEALSEI